MAFGTQYASTTSEGLATVNEDEVTEVFTESTSAAAGGAASALLTPSAPVVLISQEDAESALSDVLNAVSSSSKEQNKRADPVAAFMKAVNVEVVKGHVRTQGKANKKRELNDKTSGIG